MHFCMNPKNKINLLRYQKFKNALDDFKKFQSWYSSFMQKQEKSNPAHAILSQFNFLLEQLV